MRDNDRLSRPMGQQNEFSRSHPRSTTNKGKKTESTKRVRRYEQAAIGKARERRRTRKSDGSNSCQQELMESNKCPRPTSGGCRNETSSREPASSSSRRSSTLTLRPLPPLRVVSHHERRLGSSCLERIPARSSRNKLPPIQPNGCQLRAPKHPFRREEVVKGWSNGTTRNTSLGSAEDRVPGRRAILGNAKFVPLRASSPKHSHEALTLNSSAFRGQTARDLAVLRGTSCSVGNTTTTSIGNRFPAVDISSLTTEVGSETEDSTSKTFTSSDFAIDGDIDHTTGKSQRGIMNAGEWVRSSIFAVETQDDCDKARSSSVDTSLIPTINSSPRYYERNRRQPKDTENLRRRSSGRRPPPRLHFRIVVHERMAKLHIDLQFRLQFFKEWLGHLKLPPFPKISLPRFHVDFSRQKDALKLFGLRVKEFFNLPLILHTDQRFVLVPTDLTKFQRYPSSTFSGGTRQNRDISCLQVNPGIEGIRKWGDCDKISAIQERLKATSRKLLALVEKSEDPGWFQQWMAEHVEIDNKLQHVNRKRLRLLRALNFAMDADMRERSLHHSGFSGDDTKRRLRMRIFQQHAHHRFGIAERQPSSGLQPAAYPTHRGCHAGSDSVVCWGNSVQPMYTDSRHGCVACRLLKAARLYGCDELLL